MFKIYLFIFVIITAIVLAIIDGQIKKKVFSSKTKMEKRLKIYESTEQKGKFFVSFKNPGIFADSDTHLRLMDHIVVAETGVKTMFDNKPEAVRVKNIFINNHLKQYE